ncbi:MAG: malonic semialdehyde reductase [Cellulomonas sp.]|nr:malonic semialdehyde reductase [Cellulomonas sp.]
MTTDLNLTGLESSFGGSLAITPEDADLLFREARTAQTFTDEPVTDADLRAAWDLAKWGPTAMNTGPLRVLVAAGRDARERLASHMNEGNRQRVLDAPLSLVVAADTGFHTKLATLAPHAAGRVAHFEAEPAMRAAMARTNAMLQSGYLIIALRAVGLAVGPMSGMDAAAIDADLLAGTGWNALAVLNVGHVVGDGGAFPRAARLTWDEASLTR